ncbi:hypothetical protein Tco_1448617 [Tanacetum coccineum]
MCIPSEDSYEGGLPESYWMSRHHVLQSILLDPMSWRNHCTSIHSRRPEDPEELVNVHNRLGIVETLQGAPVSTDTELGAHVREFESMVRQDIDEIYTMLDDEQSQRQLLAGRVNMLFRDRRAHAHTRHLMETEARMSREAWGRSMDASDLARAEVISLRTTVHAQMSEIKELQSADHSRQRAISDLLETDCGRREEIRELRAADHARQQQII